MSRSRLSAQGLDPHDLIQAQISHSRSASISRSRAGSLANRTPVPAPPALLPEPTIHPPPPAPADDPDAPPPRPNFVEPQDDDEERPQELFISPPTPQGPHSPVLPDSGPSTTGDTIPPVDNDQTVLATETATGLSRSGSGGVGPRGPRPAKGPRAPPSPGRGSLSRPVSHSRSPSSIDRSASPVDPRDYAPKGKKGGRAPAGAFSRRTMASDAEDEVVDK